MLEINPNKEFIDLNGTPAVDLPVWSSENVRPMGGHVLIELVNYTLNKELVMLDFNLNKEYIDLNSSPADNDAGHLPVPSSENVPVITEEHNDAQPLGGPTLIENSRESLFPSMPGETSGAPPKRRSSKRSPGLLAGWTIEERVRHSGKSAGKTDKFFIEPRTRKKFRSMPEGRRHLGMADPKPCNNNPMKFQVHGGSR